MSMTALVLVVVASYVLAIALGHSIVALVTHGPVASLFLKAKRPRVKRRVEIAFDMNSAELAWEQVALPKLAALRARTHKQRRLALQYLDKYAQQASSAREFAAVLLEVLPHERKLDLQVEMAQALTRALELLSREEGEKAPAPVGIRPNEERLFRRNSTALAVILCTLIWLGVMWLHLESLTISALLGLSVGAIVLGSVSAYSLSRKQPKRIAAASVLVVPTIVLLGLSAASGWTHKGTNTIGGTLESLGLPQTSYVIHYPTWLTGDDIEACRRPVFLSFQDTIGIASVTLKTDSSLIYFKNRDCKYEQPHLPLDTQNESSLAVFLAPRDLESLMTGVVTVTPQLDLAASQQSIILTDSTFTINLEDPKWQVLRTLLRVASGVTGIPSVALIAFAFLRGLVGWIDK